MFFQYFYGLFLHLELWSIWKFWYGRLTLFSVLSVYCPNSYQSSYFLWENHSEQLSRLYSHAWSARNKICLLGLPLCTGSWSNFLFSWFWDLLRARTSRGSHRPSLPVPSLHLQAVRFPKAGGSPVNPQVKEKITSATQHGLISLVRSSSLPHAPSFSTLPAATWASEMSTVWEQKFIWTLALPVWGCASLWVICKMGKRVY